MSIVFIEEERNAEVTVVLELRAPAERCCVSEPILNFRRYCPPESLSFFYSPSPFVFPQFSPQPSRMSSLYQQPTKEKTS